MGSMKWNGEAEEALARLLEERELRERARAEAEARKSVEARARREGIEEIDARFVLSTLARELARGDEERVRKVIRALGLKPQEFL